MGFCAYSYVPPSEGAGVHTDGDGADVCCLGVIADGDGPALCCAGGSANGDGPVLCCAGATADGGGAVGCCRGRMAHGYSSESAVNTDDKAVYRVWKAAVAQGAGGVARFEFGDEVHRAPNVGIESVGASRVGKIGRHIGKRRDQFCVRQGVGLVERFHSGPVKGVSSDLDVTVVIAIRIRKVGGGVGVFRDAGGPVVSARSGLVRPGRRGGEAEQAKQDGQDAGSISPARSHRGSTREVDAAVRGYAVRIIRHGPWVHRFLLFVRTERGSRNGNHYQFI